MSEMFTIWTSNEAKNPGACQYYRINVPFASLFDQGYAQTYEDRGDNPSQSLKIMFNADAIHFYSIAGEATLHKVRTIKAIPPVRRDDGSMKVPPCLIFDHDDNTDFVHPFNTTFAYLGVRSYPDARLLTPGETLQWSRGGNDKLTLWEDGVTTQGAFLFDITNNLQQMKVRHAIIRECHGATASTRALAAYFRDVIGQKNVYVYPNTIVPSDYVSYPLVRRNPEEVRILWQGSMSHIVDWWPLREAIKSISEKYPQVKWVIWGEKFDWIHGAIPEHQMEHHPWVDYPAYKIKRALMQADINLCPLADNAFNRCKSAIKWYEGSVWDEPEATLAANVEPYHEIQEGVTGLLYNSPEEFVQKLSILIENADLRKRLGAAAKKWVLDNRTPEKTAPGLAEFYHDTRARQKRDVAPLVIPSATTLDIKNLVKEREALRGC